MVLSQFICGAFSEAAVVLGVLSQLGVALFFCAVQAQLISREIVGTRDSEVVAIDFHN